MAVQFSHSRVSTFNQCPYKYKLHYVDGVKVERKITPTDALILGTAMHEGIEKGPEAASQYYLSQFQMLTEEHLIEEFKLQYWARQAQRVLPLQQAIFEKKLDHKDFVGYMDMLVPLEKKNRYHLFDFKYSNNQQRYMTSGQLHEYKAFFESTHPGMIIDKMYFVFIPKIVLEKNATESLEDYFSRLEKELNQNAIELREVVFDYQKVMDFTLSIKKILETSTFHKTPSKLCGWCDYFGQCSEEERF